MSNLNSIVLRILFLCTVISFSSPTFSQVPRQKSSSFCDNWTIDVKTGVGILMTEVPYEFLRYINYVNLPVKVPGAAESFNIRKGITPHFELGYQFDYIQVNGKVVQGGLDYQVKTQAFESNFWLGYNFTRNDVIKPRLNFLMYYKIGGISLKNNPRIILADGSLAPVDESLEDNKFLTNIAVLTGVGAGVTYRISGNLSLITTFELNRSSDMGADIYKIHKIFYDSPNTVNKYITFSTGLSYSLNFSSSKESSYFTPKTEKDKKLLGRKIKRLKGKSSKAIRPDWYEH